MHVTLAARGALLQSTLQSVHRIKGDSMLRKTSGKHRRRHHRRLQVESLESRRLLSADFQLLADLEPLTESSTTTRHYFAEIGEEVLFFADDGVHGSEPWITDGTEAGTRMLADLTPGPSGSGAGTGVTAHRDYDVFAAAGELWRTDSTAAGTLPLLEGVVDPHYLTPFISVGDNILFAGRDPNSSGPPTHGFELWRSNGQPGGASLVRDITPGTNSSSFSEYVTVGDRLFFVNSDFQVWATDGTEAGTELLLETTASFSVNNTFLVAHQGDLIAGFENKLWRIDGRTLLAEQLEELPGGTDALIYDLTSAGGRLYFVSDNQLWVSDGTTASAHAIATLSTPEDRLSNVAIQETTAGVLVNLRFSQGGDGAWISDGTPVGTFKSPVHSTSFSDPVANLNGLTYFMADNSPQFPERGLWRTDGTLTGTEFVVAASSYDSNSLTTDGQRLFFTSNSQLWSSDGTAEGTIDIGSAIGVSGVHRLQVLQGKVFFTGSVGDDKEPWVSDGTIAGTHRIADIRSETRGANPSHLVGTRDQLYFLSDAPYSQGSSSTKLWRTDGEQVEWLSEWRGPSSSVRPLAALGGDLYLAAGSALLPGGDELWRLRDGVATQVVDLYPGPDTSSPDWLTVADGKLYFTARTPVGSSSAHGVWRYDPASDTATLVKASGNGFGTPGHLTEFEGELYWVEGGTLWRTVGQADTPEVVHIFDVPSADHVHSLTEAGGVLYFVAEERNKAPAIWKSDGSLAGTAPAGSDGSGEGASSLRNLAELNGSLFYVKLVTWGQVELWRTDGSPEGTSRVLDDFRGVGSLRNINGELYFQNAFDGLGAELGKLSKVTGEVELVADIAPGPQSSNPYNLTLHNGRLYVAAATFEFGNEIWVADLSPVGDYNRDLVVDAADYAMWRETLGSTTDLRADGNGDGVVGPEDQHVWREEYGVTSETGKPRRVFAADYNHDGTVDGSDYATWREGLGAAVVASTGADGNGDGWVETNDFNQWITGYGASLAGRTAAIIVTQAPALADDFSSLSAAGWASQSPAKAFTLDTGQTKVQPSARPAWVWSVPSTPRPGPPADAESTERDAEEQPREPSQATLEAMREAAFASLASARLGFRWG